MSSTSSSQRSSIKYRSSSSRLNSPKKTSTEIQKESPNQSPTAKPKPQSTPQPKIDEIPKVSNSDSNSLDKLAMNQKVQTAVFAADQPSRELRPSNISKASMIRNTSGSNGSYSSTSRNPPQNDLNPPMNPSNLAKHSNNSIGEKESINIPKFSSRQKTGASMIQKLESKAPLVEPKSSSSSQTSSQMSYKAVPENSIKKIANSYQISSKLLEGITSSVYSMIPANQISKLKHPTLPPIQNRPNDPKHSIEFVFDGQTLSSIPQQLNSRSSFTSQPIFNKTASAEQIKISLPILRPSMAPQRLNKISPDSDHLKENIKPQKLEFKKLLTNEELIYKYLINPQQGKKYNMNLPKKVLDDGGFEPKNKDQMILRLLLPAVQNPIGWNGSHANTYKRILEYLNRDYLETDQTSLDSQSRDSDEYSSHDRRRSGLESHRRGNSPRSNRKKKKPHSKHDRRGNHDKKPKSKNRPDFSGEDSKSSYDRYRLPDIDTSNFSSLTFEGI